MKAESPSPVIELSSISRRYGYNDTAFFALKDFSLTIKRGEFIMIMGPSGCGKTTLLNVLGLLDHPTDGTYFLNGLPVDRLSSTHKASLRASKIGFIFQDFNLIPTLPALENVALPLFYSGYRKTPRLIQASNLLARFDLKDREYYLPSQLSGGQKQRVAIARSLVNHPEIILADEPTGNLDSHSAALVMEELKNIHSAGNTIIMVTHNPALTIYATRVIHMLDGQIATDFKSVSDDKLPPKKQKTIKAKAKAKTKSKPKASVRQSSPKPKAPVRQSSPKPKTPARNSSSKAKKSKPGTR